MIGLWIFVGISAFFLLLLCIRFGLSLHFGGCLSVSLQLLGLRFRLYPPKRTILKRKRKQNKPSKPSQTENMPPRAPESGIQKLSRYLHTATTVIKRLRPYFRRLTKTIHLNADISLRIATDDAAKTAESYGRICSALGLLTPELYRLLTVHACSIRVNADFLHTQTEIEGDLQLTVSLGAILCVLLPLWIDLRRCQLQSNTTERTMES